MRMPPNVGRNSEMRTSAGIPDSFNEGRHAHAAELPRAFDVDADQHGRPLLQ